MSGNDSRFIRQVRSIVPKPLVELLTMVGFALFFIFVAFFGFAGARGTDLLWSIPAAVVTGLAAWLVAGAVSHWRGKR